MATSRILGLDGQPIEYDVLTEEISAPTLTGIRQVWHPSVTGNLTPSRLARILAAAAEGDAQEYLTLAEEMEERDLHYASVLGTRKLAITGLDIRVESASDHRDDVRRAEAVRECVEEAEFGELISHLVDALGKAYAVAELVWDRSGRVWMPRYEHRDPRFFTYDRNTGRELRLLDAADAFHGLPLPPYKFIVHTPKIRSGLPIRGGLARLAAVGYMCKAWSWKDWMAFADIYGLPMRVGRYGPHASKEDIAKLIAAVANLGSDAAAVMPESTSIEFEQAAQVTGAGDFFERLLTWWDKQLSKGVLGQTMTADDGASLSQARVHNEVRLDILAADARALTNTLQRAFVRPFVDLNFGPGRYPKIKIVVPKPEDTKALVDAIERLVPLGLKVEASVIRDKLGLPDPASEAELLRSHPPEPAVTPATAALNRALNTQGEASAPANDPIAIGTDELSRHAAPFIASWIEELRALVDAAGSLDAAQARLIDSLAVLSLAPLARQVAQAIATLTLAGRADAQRWIDAAAVLDTAANAEQPDAGVIRRGWQPAAEFFMQKVNLPSQRWDDLWQGEHARAFMVAGATREALLLDLRRAVEDAIVFGGSYDSFRRDFDDLIARHGWTGWTGEQSEAGRDWRARTIYRTNLATSHAAGRYRQMTHPDTLAQMPFWQYRHNTINHPRAEHQAWDGVVLRWDDPWWDVHYPPNGWGCNCDVRPLSERQLRRLGKAGPDTAPAPGPGDPPPEWAYNVGQAAYGLPPPRQAMTLADSGEWEDLTPGNWQTAGRPDVLPPRPVSSELLRVGSADELQAALTRRWGADRKIYTVRGAGGSRYDLVADAAALAGHLDVAKRPFAGHLDDALNDPDEIYLAFVRSRTTGKVALRLRAIRALQSAGRALLVVMDAQRGELLSYTLYPRDRVAQVNQLRAGKLIYGRAPDAG